MTRAEAIEKLKYERKYALHENKKAFDMAINSLKVDEMYDLAEENAEEFISKSVYEQVMWERDTAIAQLKELGYEFGEKIRTDDDCVSRKDAIRCLIYQASAEDKIRALPSVTPTERTGHWTHPKVVYMPYEYADSCSCCKEWGKILTFKANFCPNCGARMVEPQESEEISDRNMKMWEDIFKAESEEV